MSETPHDAEWLEIVTGDDSATCAICGKVTSLAMIVTHLTTHGYDPDEIANAPIVDAPYGICGCGAIKDEYGCPHGH